MHRLRRRETRRRYYRAAKIKLAAGARACDCTVVDISDSGEAFAISATTTKTRSFSALSQPPSKSF